MKSLIISCVLCFIQKKTFQQTNSLCFSHASAILTECWRVSSCSLRSHNVIEKHFDERTPLTEQLTVIYCKFSCWSKAVPSIKLTYPTWVLTWGKGKSSSQLPLVRDMLVPWKVDLCNIAACFLWWSNFVVHSPFSAWQKKMRRIGWFKLQINKYMVTHGAQPSVAQLNFWGWKFHQIPWKVCRFAQQLQTAVVIFLWGKRIPKQNKCLKNVLLQVFPSKSPELSLHVGPSLKRTATSLFWKSMVGSDEISF